MRVLERVGRMLRADAHGVMDQLEERSLVLRQSLREAEIEVARKRAALEALDEERRVLREDGERLEARVAALDADVELAMAGDDPDLARYAVRRIIPKQAALRELFVRAAELDARRTRAAERLEMQVTQLDELRPRVRAHLARRESEAATFSGDEGVTPGDEGVTDEEIELEILRRRTKGGNAKSPGTAGATRGRFAGEEGR